MQIKTFVKKGNSFLRISTFKNDICEYKSDPTLQRYIDTYNVTIKNSKCYLKKVKIMGLNAKQNISNNFKLIYVLLYNFQAYSSREQYRLQKDMARYAS